MICKNVAGDEQTAMFAGITQDSKCTQSLMIKPPYLNETDGTLINPNMERTFKFNDTLKQDFVILMSNYFSNKWDDLCPVTSCSVKYAGCKLDYTNEEKIKIEGDDFYMYVSVS